MHEVNQNQPADGADVEGTTGRARFCWPILASQAWQWRDFHVCQIYALVENKWTP